MAMLSTILRALTLVLKLAEYSPPEGADAHVAAAIAASTPHAPAELLLAMAWVESRFDATATSFVRADGKRGGGRVKLERDAGRGPRFCGVMQVQAGKKWEDCLAARPLQVGYARGAHEISSWLKATRGDVAAALRGYGCGWYGVRNECRRYDRRVLHVARSLGWSPPVPRS